MYFVFYCNPISAKANPKQTCGYYGMGKPLPLPDKQDLTVITCNCNRFFFYEDLSKKLPGWLNNRSLIIEIEVPTTFMGVFT